MIFTAVIAVSSFHFVSAHEVYVLDNGRIRFDEDMASPNPFTVLAGSHDALNKFIFWGAIQLLFVVLFLVLDYRSVLAKKLNRPLKAMKKFAPFVARVFLGISFVYGSFNHAIFGPEIPLTELGLPHTFQFILFVVGVLLIVGLLGRVAALIAFAMYFYVMHFTGAYLLSYMNYLAEIILILIAGSGVLSLDNILDKYFSRERGVPHHWGRRFEEKYGPLLLRVGLAVALIYAAVNVKFLHSQLSLDVIQEYGLTKFFPFDPLFIVLGAGLVELCIAAMFLSGVLVRINTLLFLTFITLSLLYFGEAVWPHFILFGISLAILMYGYDGLTLQKPAFEKLRGKAEEGVF